MQLDKFVANGTTLYEWLGTFWTRIYEDQEFAKSLQQGEGLLAAQLYLLYLESLNLQDRYNLPVLHRERWFPIVIKRSQAGQGDATALRVDMDPTPVVGPQTGVEFVQGAILQFGGTANLVMGVTYPLPAASVDIITSIVDNPVNPRVILTRSTDYTIDQETVMFLRDKDPFTLTAFPRQTIVNADGTTDEAIVLWACNFLVDVDYVFNYLGYALNIRTPSREFYKKFLNATWDLYNQGTPISWLKSAIGAMLGEPTVIHSGEVVEALLTTDTSQQVVTDREVYTVPANAVLEDNVTLGAVLDQWQYLTKTIRLYTHIDPMKLTGSTEYGVQIKTDVQAVFFDRSMLRARVAYGVSADWQLSDIVKDGVDSKGNARLKFTLYGTDDDLDIFWSDFWSWLATNDMTSEECFVEYLYPIHPIDDGAVYGQVAPLEFLFRYFLKYNTFVIVVDKSRLITLGEGVDQVGYLNLLQRVIPAHTRLLVEEQYSPEAEEYDLNDLGSSVDFFISTEIAETADYGGPSTSGLTYKDRPPVIRLIPSCG